MEKIKTIIILSFMILSCGKSTVLGVTPLTLLEITDGLIRPVYLTSSSATDQRLFIVEQPGKIKIFKNNLTLPNPFLDISTMVTTANEQGLLGLAFAPDYETTGRFYINYTNNSGATVIARYSVSTNPDSADQTSGEIILTLPQPYQNHNGGMIAFSPIDNYLYIGLGDGGAAGDPQNRAQDPTSLFGKMLRIDVSGVGPGYVIPSSNPFVGTVDTLGEIWSFGLRNPWRYSFDRENGDLWIADVGQNAIEEIDYQISSSTGGENYGWRLKEGTACFNPNSGCDPDGSLIDPIHEYTHGGSPHRCSVTGGYVYRGCAIPDLTGTYFFGDFCSGQIWSFKYNNGVVIEFSDRTSELGLISEAISSFGEDNQGELYIVGYNSGKLFKIVPDGEPSQCACCENPGDANSDNLIGISDLTFFVDYMFNAGIAPSCFEEFDNNGDCEFGISDLTLFIEYLFQNGSVPGPCHNC